MMRVLKAGLTGDHVLQNVMVARKHELVIANTGRIQIFASGLKWKRQLVMQSSAKVRMITCFRIYSSL